MAELLENLGIKWQLLIAQVVNFLILLFILRKFLYGPMMKFLRERRQTIEEGLKKSELAEVKFREFRDLQAKELAQTRSEAQKIIEDAKKRAEEAKNQILQDARIQTEGLFKKAERDIDSLKAQKLKEAERELGAMAIEGMEYLIREKVSDDRKSQLADEAIAHIKNS